MAATPFGGIPGVQGAIQLNAATGKMLQQGLLDAAINDKDQESNLDILAVASASAGATGLGEAGRVSTTPGGRPKRSRQN